MLPTQFTNAAPFPAARAAGPAPKPANSLAGLPVAHPFHSAADRLPAADREPVVVNPPAATGTHSARNPYAAVTVRCNAYPYGQFRFRCDGPVGQVANYEGQTRYLPFPHPLRLAGVLKISRSVKALRRLLSFAAGIQPRKQSACRLCKCLFRSVAPAFHEQEHRTGVAHEVGNIIRARGNFSQARNGGQGRV